MPRLLCGVDFLAVFFFRDGGSDDGDGGVVVEMMVGRWCGGSWGRVTAGGVDSWRAGEVSVKTEKLSGMSFYVKRYDMGSTIHLVGLRYTILLFRGRKEMLFYRPFSHLTVVVVLEFDVFDDLGQWQVGSAHAVIVEVVSCVMLLTFMRLSAACFREDFDTS
ncbi:hypothetical protein Tco_0773007 [Tanacetum coccineum]|uniref:Uncharacterized protein n=1 Tax=Tanacetum coccineum TaxID=301880 RepID=A0ABQ4ZLP8_9ASTR